MIIQESLPVGRDAIRAGPSNRHVGSACISNIRQANVYVDACISKNKAPEAINKQLLRRPVGSFSTKAISCLEGPSYWILA